MAFGISKNIRSRDVQNCTPALFNAAINSTDVAKICAEIEDALEASRKGQLSKEDYETLKADRKKQLPVFTPHATFKAGRRLNADAIPSGLSMYDIDHIENPSGYFVEHIEKRTAELGIVLAHVTPSLQGLRLFFVMPEGTTLESAQKWMSSQLENATYDQSVKDYARCSFVVPRSYILYINETGLFEERTVVASVKEVIATEPPSAEEDDVTPRFNGLSYADIIKAWFDMTGGEPVPGERNDKLHRLASHLRYITDSNEALLLKIIPRYGLGEGEMKELIHSACSLKLYAMPRLLREVIDRVNNGFDDEDADDELPPELPKKLPPLVELLLSCTPELYKPAVAHAIFPPLAAHLHRVRFEYIDNVEHEATLMNVLMAGTGAGKDCITMPINKIMADIRQRDEENLRREEEWKDEVNSKGSNKDKRLRPEGLVIQEIDADMTNPAFVMRTAEADGHFLYTKMNEIEQFDSLRGSGRGGQQFLIMCLAFDPGNRYGQTRVGTQSVTKKVTVRFNWNAVTTILKGKRYFARVLTDGPISRINFCTIPSIEIGGSMPIYGKYAPDFDERLRPYIDNLTHATGLIDIPQARRLAWQLKEENALQAVLTQSRTYENLSFRANVIAWLKACVLYVAQGCQWDDTTEAFVRWSLKYDLWCKMKFFGEAMEEAMSEDSMEGSGCRRNGPRNLLELLPERFTYADAVNLRRRFGKGAKGTRKMITTWIYRNLAAKDTTQDAVKTFVKLKK